MRQQQIAGYHSIKQHHERHETAGDSRYPSDFPNRNRKERNGQHQTHGQIKGEVIFC